MSMKRFYYTDIDGDHFPDATLGDDLVYALDLNCWLASEEEEVISADWELPQGVTSKDSFLVEGVANVSLRATQVGSFRVKCVIETREETAAGTYVYQSKSIINVLRVFN